MEGGHARDIGFLVEQEDLDRLEQLEAAMAEDLGSPLPGLALLWKAFGLGEPVKWPKKLKPARVQARGLCQTPRRVPIAAASASRSKPVTAMQTLKLSQMPQRAPVWDHGRWARVRDGGRRPSRVTRPGRGE
ncbi:MAG: hypothetical protein R3F65_32040 [bacterium]